MKSAAGTRMSPARPVRSWSLRQVLSALALLVVLALPAAAAFAQASYPQPVDNHVNDFAALLTPEETAAIRQAAQELKRATGAALVVATIQSISSYDTPDRTLEEFATSLFNTWGVGEARRNDGVLVLLAVRDRRVRIELGAGYHSSYDAEMQAIIDEQMLPHFKRGAYGEGLVAGVRALVQRLGSPGGDPAAPIVPAGSRQQHVPWELAGGAGVLGAGAVGARSYLRHRTRRCSNCRSPMARLDEAADDVYLDSGQQLEEYLRSVDYDIWKCPGCQMHHVEPYRTWFSSYKPCPGCSYTTLFVSSVTESSPTYASTGRKRITRQCKHCAFYDEDVVVLPMLQRSRSSGGGSSSSYGGGRSSGGGASGSW